ncbi:NRDE protein-domain-containing protein [Kockovaella imperatae]|uniref:NRDE protein-domain-containing protein n=1 Tax=Kockovaella imperatae TaxID=4999 RepID=A0A1Y1UD50_9TREE|nr:NRDE protein-domain-containing protein [Kockovaella imperatae]ORX35446.1 NRDE protein-domain-containing protein [Kockovaella imperatae]
MCIVFWTLSHPGYKLILASNRDEYLARPALPAHWHTFGPIEEDQEAIRAESSKASTGGKGSGDQHADEPWIMCGRDMGSPEAGTWLGMTKDLRIGVLTSIRQGFKRRLFNPPSRGALVKDFLKRKDYSTSVHDHLASLRGTVEDYDGFNLLLFRLHPPSIDALDPDPQNEASEQPSSASAKSQASWGRPEVGYLSNHPSQTLMDIMSPTRVPTPVARDRSETLSTPLKLKGTKVGMCFGLSNSSISQPWPKVSRGEAEMSQTLREWSERKEGEEELIKRMQDLLSRSVPLTSLANVKECTCLHPVKLGTNPDEPLDTGLDGRWYGTRVSTVILVKNTGEVTFVEKSIFYQDENGDAVEGKDERVFRWSVM